MVSEVRYLPYGEERWASGESVTDFGFTSQRNDSYIKLYDYGARYYNPYLNRFISPDTIVPEPGSSGGFNRYRYTRNNPLRYTDPSGHYECNDTQGHCLPKDAIPIHIPDVPDDYILSHFNEQGIPTDVDFYDPSNAVGRSIIEDQIIANAYRDGVIGEDAYGALGQRSMGQRMGAISEGEAVAMMFAGMAGAFAGKMTGGGGSNIVYRGLAEGEDPQNGLSARVPGLQGVEPSSHVAGLRNSPWISTTKDPNVALDKYGKNGVVAVDLSKITTETVDLSNGVPGIPGNSMLSRWAAKDQEVLIRDYIPSEAIIGNIFGR